MGCGVFEAGDWLIPSSRAAPPQDSARSHVRAESSPISGFEMACSLDSDSQCRPNPRLSLDCM